jgi:hypothetical protein
MSLLADELKIECTKSGYEYRVITEIDIERWDRPLMILLVQSRTHVDYFYVGYFIISTTS